MILHFTKPPKRRVVVRRGGTGWLALVVSANGRRVRRLCVWPEQPDAQSAARLAAGINQTYGIPLDLSADPESAARREIATVVRRWNGVWRIDLPNPEGETAHG